MGCNSSKVAPRRTIPNYDDEVAENTVTRVDNELLATIERIKQDELDFVAQLTRFNFDSLGERQEFDEWSLNIYYDARRVIIPLQDKWMAFRNSDCRSMSELIDCNIMVVDEATNAPGPVRYINLRDCIERPKADHYYALQYLPDTKEFIIVPYTIYERRLKCYRPLKEWDEFPDCNKITSNLKIKLADHPRIETEISKFLYNPEILLAKIKTLIGK